jgi:hypothetical protein
MANFQQAIKDQVSEQATIVVSKALTALQAVVGDCHEHITKANDALKAGDIDQATESAAKAQELSAVLYETVAS